MNAIRVLICDDEPLALDRLSDLVDQCAGVELTGAFQSGRELLDRIGALRPDLLLLDVEMPHLDGFDVVEALMRRAWPDPEAVPLICFVTAFPQFAPDAFESGALDFLAKPVRLQRLEKTLARARAALAQREAVRRMRELSDQLEALRLSSRPQEERSLWIHTRGEMIRLEYASLDWLQAEGEYVRLHTGDRSYLFRHSIGAMADELAPHGFVRIHRSAVINRERLTTVRRTPGGGMRVRLSSGLELAVGRSFRDKVHALTLAKA